MTPSPRGPLPDAEVDRLESYAFKGLLSNRITPEFRDLVHDFASYGNEGIDTIVEHFNDRLQRFYSPYRLAADGASINLLRMENGQLLPTGPAVEVPAGN